MKGFDMQTDLDRQLDFWRVRGIHRKEQGESDYQEACVALGIDPESNTIANDAVLSMVFDVAGREETKRIVAEWQATQAEAAT